MLGIALLGRARRGIHALLGSRSGGAPARSRKAIVGRVARRHVGTSIHIGNFLGSLKSWVHQAGLVGRAGIPGIRIRARRTLLVVAIAGTGCSLGIRLLLGKVASGTSVAWGTRSWVFGSFKGIPAVEMVLLLLLLLEGRVLSRSMMLTRLMRLGVSILHCM